MRDLYAAGAKRIAQCVIDTAELAKKEGKGILIFVHKSVDGDCLGSSSALATAIRKLGAEAAVAVPEPVPDYLGYLDIGDLCIFPDAGEVDTDLYRYAISTDCTEANRMGPREELFSKYSDTISIDHHEVESLADDRKWIMPDASSASEMVFYVIEAMSGILSVPVSELTDERSVRCLLCGIVSDTGRFTYSNTRSETLETAGRLSDMGASISEAGYNLFDMKKQGEFLASNYMCATAEFFCDGRIAVAYADNDVFERFGADNDDVNDVVSRLRDVDTVELAICLRRTKNGDIRGNLRSKSYVDCAAFAATLGGGGHKRAAGFTVKQGGDIRAVAEEVRKKAEKLL